MQPVFSDRPAVMAGNTGFWRNITIKGMTGDVFILNEGGIPDNEKKCREADGSLMVTLVLVAYFIGMLQHFLSDNSPPAGRIIAIAVPWR